MTHFSSANRSSTELRSNYDLFAFLGLLLESKNTRNDTRNDTQNVIFQVLPDGDLFFSNSPPANFSRHFLPAMSVSFI
jgi:hypothetical protein